MRRAAAGLWPGSQPLQLAQDALGCMVVLLDAGPCKAARKPAAGNLQAAAATAAAAPAAMPSHLLGLRLLLHSRLCGHGYTLGGRSKGGAAPSSPQCPRPYCQSAGGGQAGARQQLHCRLVRLQAADRDKASSFAVCMKSQLCLPALDLRIVLIAPSPRDPFFCSESRCLPHASSVWASRLALSGRLGAQQQLYTRAEAIRPPTQQQAPPPLPAPAAAAAAVRPPPWTRRRRRACGPWCMTAWPSTCEQQPRLGLGKCWTTRCAPPELPMPVRSRRSRNRHAAARKLALSCAPHCRTIHHLAAVPAGTRRLPSLPTSWSH